MDKPTEEKSERQAEELREPAFRCGCGQVFPSQQQLDSHKERKPSH